jgi:ElaB/YqjD/DUF883 family membrane-anchored ribosome-binding protein
MDDHEKEPTSRVGHLMDEIREKGGNILGAVREKVAQSSSTMRTKSFDDLSHDAKTYVKNHPGKVVLVSFAVGVVLGALIRGRNRG